MQAAREADRHPEGSLWKPHFHVEKKRGAELVFEHNMMQKKNSCLYKESLITSKHGISGWRNSAPSVFFTGCDFSVLAKKYFEACTLCFNMILHFTQICSNAISGIDEGQKSKFDACAIKIIPSPFLCSNYKDNSIWSLIASLLLLINVKNTSIPLNGEFVFHLLLLCPSTTAGWKSGLEKKSD